MLYTFTRPLALFSHAHGLMHVQAAYVERSQRCLRGPLADSIELVISKMVIRCDGQRRELGDEQLTVFIQPSDVMAAQETRL